MSTTGTLGGKSPSVRLLQYSFLVMVLQSNQPDCFAIHTVCNTRCVTLKGSVCERGNQRHWPDRVMLKAQCAKGAGNNTNDV